MRKSGFVLFLVAALVVVTLVSMALVPSTFAQGGAPTPTPMVGQWTTQSAIDLYNIGGTYSVFACEYEGRVEPNCIKFSGTIQMINPFDLWVDGYRRCDGEVREVYAEMQRAERISIPPDYTTTQECFVEVLVARPWPPTQQSSLELRGDSEVQWALEDAAQFYELEVEAPLDSDATAMLDQIRLHGLQSWEVPAIEGVTWISTNVCGNWLDGFRVLPGEVRPDFSQHPEKELVSIPPHSYRVEAAMLTLRPCDESQFYSLINSNQEVVNLRSEPSEAAQIIRQLASGQSVESDGYVEVADQQWYRVYLDEGRAWVAGWVVQVTPINEATSIAPIATPTVETAAPQTAPVSDWSESAVHALFGIPAEVALSQCPGETACWSGGVAGTLFSFTNPTTCWQGGYAGEAHELMPGQTDPKTGYPPGWTGQAELVVLRPCGQ